MAGVPDQTANASEKRLDENETTVGASEAEMAHRRMEHNANKAAQRAGDRMKKDEAGHDEFSNIGPV